MQARTHRRSLPHRQQSRNRKPCWLQLGPVQWTQWLDEGVQLHPLGRIVEVLLQRRLEGLLQLPRPEPGLPHQQPESDW